MSYFCEGRQKAYEERKTPYFKYLGTPPLKITMLLYNISVYMANNDKIRVSEPPKMPSMFGRKTSVFSGGINVGGKKFGGGAKVTPPQIRITQSKGAGGK